MRSEHQKRVDEFMVLAGQDVPKVPAMVSPDIRVLRARLILEEALETAAGLGVSVNHCSMFLEHVDQLRLVADREPNLVEVVDGCCDIKVVTTGTLTALGVDDEEVQKIVDDNNLAKFGPGGYRREDGKWIKPPGHKAPTEDISIELERQKGRVS